MVLEQAVLAEDYDTIVHHNLEQISQPPQFVGGTTALYAFIDKKLKYPKEAIEKKLEGVVYVDFTVEKNGELTDIKVISSPHEILNKEAFRIVKSMPKWIPAEKYREPVRSRYTVAIEFKL